MAVSPGWPCPRSELLAVAGVAEPSLVWRLAPLAPTGSGVLARLLVFFDAYNQSEEH